MELSKDEIIKLIKKSRNPILKESEILQNNHKVHITGDGFEFAIKQIVGYENTEQFREKKLMTKPFTRPLMKYIIDAQSRWKTAQGTTKVYLFKGDDKKDAAKNFETNILSQVWKDASIENFIGKFLTPAVYTEFNGFFIVDKGKIETEDGVTVEKKQGKTKVVDSDFEPLPYIIFKSVTDIHQFSVTGDTVDWIIYKLPDLDKGNKRIVKQFRVIDNKFDYLVELDKDNVTIVDVKEHEAATTPVVPVSSINKNLGDDNKRTSPIDALLPVLDYYLNQYAEHVVSSILHAHPMYYQVGQKCTHRNQYTKCDDGRLMWEFSGEKKDIECPSCRGEGVNIRKDASTVIILPAKTDEGDAFNISNVVGYASPPIDILKHQMVELDKIKEEILAAALGQIGSQNLRLEKTATETILNLKPLEDIISEILDWVERCEIQLTDIIGKMSSGEKYIGAQINRGRKLNLREENQILEEIKKAKENGSSYYYIKTLNDELIFSRFSKSETELQRNIIAAQLEPFVGFTYDEIEGSDNITKEQKFIKQNFTEYLQRLETDEGDLLDIVKGEKKIEDFQKKMLTFAQEDIANMQVETNQNTFTS